MPQLVSLADARDIIIIIYGIIGIVFFFVAIIVAVVIGLSIRALIKAVRGMLDDSVKPVLGSVKDAADTVRGTTEFVGRTTVGPVVRVYGTVAGIKKGLSVLSGFKGRGKG